MLLIRSHAMRRRTGRIGKECELTPEFFFAGRARHAASSAHDSGRTDHAPGDDRGDDVGGDDDAGAGHVLRRGR